MANDSQASAKESMMSRWLARMEVAGNKLPDPALLFVILGLAILVLSAIGEALGWRVVNPATGAEIVVTSLLTGDGLRRIFTSFLSNVSGFGPLPSVLVIMIGLGVAEHSGMLKAILTKTTSNLPRSVVTMVLIFIAISSNLASDSGFIVLPPLAALIFISMGMHPFIGMAAVYGAVSAGFNANIFLCTGDVLIAGMTEAAARIIDPEITINPAVNYYFMAFCCIPLTLVGVWVTRKFVAPRFRSLEGIELTDEKIEKLTADQERGLRQAGITFLILLAVIGIGVLPGGLLRDPETGTLVPSPLITSTVFFMTVLFLIPSIVYGRAVGSIKKDTDAVRMATSGVASVAGFIVLAVVASQFISWFGWSNLGIFIAIKGAQWLQAIGLQGIPLAVGVALICAVVNMFIGSQTAKWALISTIFVPMLMLLDFHPAYTQVLYRIGDSVTNAISPLFTYFPLFVGFLKKYDKSAGIGTAFTLMLPYSIFYLITFLLVLVVWTWLGIPLGPEGAIWMR